MDVVVSWLNQPLLNVWGNPLSSAEVFGFATGLWCVWLTARKSIWNFPLGITNSALFFFLFWEGRLFADASLQILFITLSLLGWWQWSQGRIDKQLPISRLGSNGMLISCVAGIAMIIGLYGVLSAVKGSVPIFDAAITGLSIVAQYLLNQRKLESWFFWISVDVISIPVYIHKELYLIALLYTVFLVLCVIGYRQWLQDVSVSTENEAVGEVAA